MQIKYKMLSILVAFVLLGVTICSAVYFLGKNGEGFKFVSSFVQSSPDIHAQFGSIKQIRLYPFMTFSDEYIKDDHVAEMVVDVEGTQSSGKLHVFAKKRNGAWMIEKIVPVDKN